MRAKYVRTRVVSPTNIKKRALPPRPGRRFSTAVNRDVFNTKKKKKNHYSKSIKKKKFTFKISLSCRKINALPVSVRSPHACTFRRKWTSVGTAATCRTPNGWRRTRLLGVWSRDSTFIQDSSAAAAAAAAVSRSRSRARRAAVKNGQTHVWWGAKPVRSDESEKENIVISWLTGININNAMYYGKNTRRRSFHCSIHGADEENVVVNYH